MTSQQFIKTRADRPANKSHLRPRVSVPSLVILIIGAIYTLFPVLWVLMASTKNGSELFNSFTLFPSGHLFENLARLSTYDGGIYWRWTANTFVYAAGGAIGATFVSALSGYVLAKYNFPGKQVVFISLLAGVLVPGVILAVPQYLLFAHLGLTNNYLAVLLPSLMSPYGIFLARIYAAASVPTEIIEAARTDGASDFRIFTRIAMPMMFPGLITIFLFQFVAIWNNFILPNLMLSNGDLFPLTVGLNALLTQGTGAPAAYSLVIPGALVAIIPLIVLFVVLQRFWKVDIAAGAVKS